MLVLATMTVPSSSVFEHSRLGTSAILRAQLRSKCFSACSPSRVSAIRRRLVIHLVRTAFERSNVELSIQITDRHLIRLRPLLSADSAGVS